MAITPNANFKALYATLSGNLLLLVFTSVLYWQARDAGFVSDFTGWLDQIENHTFSEYINRTNFGVRSMYQGTQFVTWLLYQVLHTNTIAWHWVFVLLHWSNTVLLIRFVKNLFIAAGAYINNNWLYLGAILFTASPYIVEVIVWEPSFHYLQGLFLILLTLLCLQKYLSVYYCLYIYCGLIVYCFAVFTLEVFYLTPIYALLLVFWYQYSSTKSSYAIRKTLVCFVLPLFAILICRILLFRVLSGDWVSRIGSSTFLDSISTSGAKPLCHLVDIFFLFRYLPDEWIIRDVRMGYLKDQAYTFLSEPKFYFAIYIFVGIFTIRSIVRWAFIKSTVRVAILLFLYAILTLILTLPLWYQHSMLVIYDRYKYLTIAWLTMAIAAKWSYKPLKSSIGIFFIVIITFNVRYAVRAIRYWSKSSKVIKGLFETFPMKTNKIVLLLNSPECMNGIQMLGSNEPSEFALIYKLLYKPNTPMPIVKDVLSYNMQTPEDGASVVFINDSSLKVTLNQWGSWWWYASFGAVSYENDLYKVNLVDPGHEYIITLKSSSERFLLLRQQGSSWIEVTH